MNSTEPMPALLEAYFADLDRALIGTDEREHAETVQAMREHAAEMLHRHGVSEQTAERVIGDFGPVEQVAAAATRAPAPAAASPAPRSWSDIWLVAGAVVSLLFYVFPLFAIAMLIWAILKIRRTGGNRTLQKAALWISGVSVAFSIGMFISHYLHTL